VLDAFFLSHTYEAIEIPGQEATDSYLPPYKPSIYLDVKEPHAFGGIVPQDIYMEFRYKMQIAMDEALGVAEAADAEYKQRFGRGYGLVEPYQTDGAEVILLTSGTVASTTRVVIDELRAKGLPVGMLKVRLFRPFPMEQVRQDLGNCKRVAVLDRNICPGLGGIFAQEVRNALYAQDAAHRPDVMDYIVGLGGRDVTPEVIHRIAEDAFKRNPTDAQMVWIGLKE